MPRRAATQPGCLYVVATPIGNLEDITQRAVRVLAEVDLIAAEDTRSARVLLGRHEVQTATTSFFKGNEARRGAELLRRLEGGASVALISEAGMPGISDPGERLVRRCVEQGIEVDVVPGPSACLAALVLSGLPTGRFLFLGFLPRQNRPRSRVIEQLRFEPGTVVLYEAARRVAGTLEDLSGALGERPAAVVRELTKLHQQVLRGGLAELAVRCAEDPPRGEVTLVVGGAADRGLPREALESEIRARLDQGQSPRQIADALAAHGRRPVYQRALELRRSSEEA